MVLLHIIDLGESAFLLPSALALSGWAGAAGRSWRKPAVWLASLGTCCGTAALLKLLLMTCDAGDTARPFSISGHATLSAFFYGMIAACLLQSARPGKTARLIALATGAVPFVIGAALVTRGDHTPCEVAAGLCLGGGGMLAAFRIAPPPQLTRLRARRCLMFALALVMTAAYVRVSLGGRSPSELDLRHLARTIRAHGIDAACPFGTRLPGGVRPAWEPPGK